MARKIGRLSDLDRTMHDIRQYYRAPQGGRRARRFRPRRRRILSACGWPANVLLTSAR